MNYFTELPALIKYAVLDAGSLHNLLFTRREHIFSALKNNVETVSHQQQVSTRGERGNSFAAVTFILVSCTQDGAAVKGVASTEGGAMLSYI